MLRNQMWPLVKNQMLIMTEVPNQTMMMTNMSQGLKTKSKNKLKEKRQLTIINLENLIQLSMRTMYQGIGIHQKREIQMIMILDLLKVVGADLIIKEKADQVGNIQEEVAKVG